MEQKGWAVLEKGKIPWIGNGNQWQYPIFRTRAEAKEYLGENHGLQEPEIAHVEVTLTN